MTSHLTADPVDERTDAPGGPEEPEAARRRSRWKVVGIVAAAVLVVLAAAVAWFFLGREEAEQVSADQLLDEFRSNGGAASSEGDGRPAPGVYEATASGTESIGLPGFDEELGPNAPVTLTHGADGCFTYRADFNSHHWRSWTYCPSDTASFALVGLESWTVRKAPGLDIESLTTYTCDRPVDLLWDGAAVGDTRDGSCTGTSDVDEGFTEDSARVEVLEVGSTTVGEEQVDAIRVRVTDTFSGAQTGSEVGEWWLHAETGLPLRAAIEASVEGASGSYSEDPTFELATLRPAT